MSYEPEKESDFKRTCHICGTEYDIRGTDELHESENGETVCDDCLDKVVRFGVYAFGFASGFYGFAECNGDELSTRTHTTRKETKDALSEMIEKLWSGVEKVEVD